MRSRPARGTLLLDFDSTLVPVESLEVVLARQVEGDPARVRELEELTRRGMEGELTFAESLAARLAIASPTRDAVEAVGEELAGQLTRGAVELIAWAHSERIVVRIVSGGFREVILPSARRAGVALDGVHAVNVRWGDDAIFTGLSEDGFQSSKVEGVRRLAPEWPHPIVAVGDGATDRALAEAGLADHFVAYTEHVRRAFVENARDAGAGVPEAGSMDELRGVLSRLFPDSFSAPIHDP